MAHNLPDDVLEILLSVGQVAAELPCEFEDCREFVSIFRIDTAAAWGFQRRYPYLADRDVAYRAVRFRVDAERIDRDENVCDEDLCSLQNIYVATEEEVAAILKMWAVSPGAMRRPSETEIPI